MAVAQLLAVDTDIATGCVPVCREGRAVITVATESDEHYQPKWFPFWFEGVIPITRCGMACCLIKREVFEKLGFPWFRWPSEHILEPKG